jgi:hypothetical protein
MMHPEGYVLLLCPNHPRCMAGGYVLEHILVAERAIGHFLPKGAEIHHWNEVKTENRNRNLVICPNRAYHLLLHARMRIQRAGGKILILTAFVRAAK